jgi:hypothetical protein
MASRSSSLNCAQHPGTAPLSVMHVISGPKKTAFSGHALGTFTFD